LIGLIRRLDRRHFAPHLCTLRPSDACIEEADCPLLDLQTRRLFSPMGISRARRLAGYLRLAGFDAAYRNDCADEDLAAVSRNEDRILLTRDRELLKRSIVSRGYFVRETIPRRQLAEVIRRFDLARAMAPLTRCARCNEVLAPAAKEAVADRLPAHVRSTRCVFLRCPGCGRVYWDGTHVDQIRRFLRLTLEEPPPV